jgi:DNA invertase Pin-like site-specific DNA recombinase
MRLFYSKDCEPTPGSHVERDHAIGRAKPGDVLVIPSIDHLGSNPPEVETNLTYLAEKKVTLAVRQSSRKPDEPLQVWVRRDLRRAAYDRAAARGSYSTCTGRPPKADHELAVKLHAAGIAPEQIAAVLDVSERTIWRYLARQEAA